MKRSSALTRWRLRNAAVVSSLLFVGLNFISPAVRAADVCVGDQCPGTAPGPAAPTEEPGGGADDAPAAAAADGENGTDNGTDNGTGQGSGATADDDGDSAGSADDEGSGGDDGQDDADEAAGGGSESGHNPTGE